MRIVMLVSMAGPGLTVGPGDELDLPADEARSLIDAGFAEKPSRRGRSNDDGDADGEGDG